MTHTPDTERLRTLLALVAIGLRHAIADQLAAHPKAAAYDSDRTSGGHGGDPTPTAALTRDPARHDLERHDHAIDMAYAALLTLVGLSDKYLPAHQPRRGDLEADTRTCHLHDRANATTQHHHGKHRSDLASFVTPPPFKEPVHVCAPCYEQVRRIGRLPTNDELIRHDRTGKWAARTTGKREAVWTAANIAKDWEGAA